MSGGRGGYRRRSYDWSQLYDQAASETDQAEYEAEIAQILQDALREFNDRDVTGIQKHLETLEEALSKYIDGTMRMAFGGSIQKHTYVDGLSDADMLVSLNDTSLAGKTPGEVLAYFESVLKQRLPRTEVKPGKLAVTVKFSDGHEIQLLPAIKTATGLKIAQPDGSSWSNVVLPQRFAKKLTEVNQKLGNKVVPVIKLAKAMNQKLPNTTTRL